MEDFITDDELIYLIKQDNKEAYGLLFSRYEILVNTKLKTLIPSLKTGLEEDDIKSIFYDSFNSALIKYQQDKGTFFNYFYKILVTQIKNEYRRISLINNRESLEDIELYDCNYKYEEKADYNRVLDLIVKKDKSKLEIIKLWSQGYTYKEISELLNMEAREVEYQIQTLFKYIKKKMIN